MSVYNGWPYIKEAVESVINQTYGNYEFIIVDDGSTDETSAYLDSIDDFRIRVIHQENQGLGKPLNRWMKQCRGEYIMRMDADDINRCDRVEKQKTFLENNPDVIMVGCQIGYFTASGKFGEVKSNYCVDHDSILTGLKQGWSTISHPAIMFRRSLLEKIDGYVITGAGEDYSLIMDAARYGNLANLDEVLYLMRIRKGSAAWENGLRTLAGFEYARKRYAAAEMGQEYSLIQFEKEWAEKSFLYHIRLKGKALAMISYRKAKIDSINGKNLRAAFRIMIAAILDMNSTAGWFMKRVKTKNSNKIIADT